MRRTGIDLVRFAPTVKHPFPVLPMAVRDRISVVGQEFFFVQVGAHDGVRDDPLHDLVVENGLRGILIEPLPDLFDSLRANYAGQPQLRFENVAVGPEDGDRVIYRVDANAPLSRYWQGLASFDMRHLLKEGVPRQYIRELTVPVVRLESLIERHSVSRIDLLQIDTEGYDHVILESVIGAGLLPHVINYEHCHLKPRVRFACNNLLIGAGYRFLEIDKDTLAIRA